MENNDYKIMHNTNGIFIERCINKSSLSLSRHTYISQMVE